MSNIVIATLIKTQTLGEVLSNAYRIHGINNIEDTQNGADIRYHYDGVGITWWYHDQVGITGCHYDGVRIIRCQYDGGGSTSCHYDGVRITCCHYDGVNIIGYYYDGVRIIWYHYDGGGSTWCHYDGVIRKKSVKRYTILKFSSKILHDLFYTKFTNGLP